MGVMRDAAMIAQHCNALGECSVVGGQRSGLAPCSEIFARIEAEAASSTDGASTEPSTIYRHTGAMRLACVLYEIHAEFMRELTHGAESRWRTVQMHRNYRFGAISAGKAPSFEIVAQ